MIDALRAGRQQSSDVHPRSRISYSVAPSDANRRCAQLVPDDTSRVSHAKGVERVTGLPADVVSVRHDIMMFAHVLLLRHGQEQRATVCEGAVLDV